MYCWTTDSTTKAVTRATNDCRSWMLFLVFGNIRFFGKSCWELSEFALLWYCVMFQLSLFNYHLPLASSSTSPATWLCFKRQFKNCFTITRVCCYFSNYKKIVFWKLFERAAFPNSLTGFDLCVLQSIL